LKKWPCTLFPHVSLAPACEWPRETVETQAMQHGMLVNFNFEQESHPQIFEFF